jgi:hypothetical protein
MNIAEPVEVLIGIGILIGFPLILTVLAKIPVQKGIIGFALVVSPFIYKAGLIDIWVIVVLMILGIIILFLDVKKYIKGD